MRAIYNGQEYDVTRGGAGYTLVSVNQPNTSVSLTEDEYTKTGLPPFKAALSMEFAAKALGVVTIASEFGDELYPVKAGEVKSGDQVYVKPLRVFGNVIRVVGDKHMVEVTIHDQGAAKTMVNPYWLHELEKRSKE